MYVCYVYFNKDQSINQSINQFLQYAMARVNPKIGKRCPPPRGTGTWLIPLKYTHYSFVRRVLTLYFNGD